MSRVRQIWLVARREILERGRSRGFLFAVVFTQLLIIGSFALPAFLGGDQTLRLGVVDPAPPTLDGALQAFAAPQKVKLSLTHVASRAAGEAAVNDESISALLVVPPDLSSPGQVLVKNRPSDQVQSIVVPAVVTLRQGPIAPPSVVALDPNAEQQQAAFLLANVGVIILFVSIFSFGTWVLSGVVEEKQSRVVEVVLATVRPRDLLMGKVLGIGLLGLVQLAVFVITGVIVANVTGRIQLPATTGPTIAMTLLWFALGYAIYATALGVLGALASRMEEASNASAPVSMFATVSYVIALLVVTQDPDGVVATVMTFIPPMAPMVVPLRAALDAIPLWQVVAAPILAVVAIYALFEFGARVYSGAVLQTGGRMRLRDAWRASR